MKLSLNHLNSYLDKEVSIAKLEEILLNTELELEEVNSEEIASTVVIGKVLSISKHPDADKLNVAIVNIGEVEKQIVCGAPNLEEGQYVAVAKEGTIIGDMLIEARELRGVISKGMICSEKELGISDEHNGIMVFEGNLEVGKPVNEYIDNTVLDIDIPANRADYYSVYGIAREVSAHCDSKLLELDVASIPDNKELLFTSSSDTLQSLSAIRGTIKAGMTTPEYIKDYLEASDQQSINILTDISNFVMLETGVPSHIYDSSKLELPLDISETSGKLTLLDDTEVELSNDTTISDKNNIIGVAGIKGGLSTGTDADTTDIIVECAIWDKQKIRRLALSKGLQTEAAKRYEKGLSPRINIELAMPRLISLLIEHAGLDLDSVVSQVIKSEGTSIGSIEIDNSYLSRKIGQDVNLDDYIERLKKLSIDVTSNEKGYIIIPAWFRTDLIIKDDIVEEVAKLIGLNNIEAVSDSTIDRNPRSDQYLKEFELKRLLTSLGFNEQYNYSIRPESDLKLKINEDPIVISNPVSNQASNFRKSIIPSLIDNLANNQAHNLSSKESMIFEVSNIFNIKEKDVNQRKAMALVSTEESGYDSIKASLSNILDNYNIHNYELKLTKNEIFADGQIANIVVNGELIGVFGIISADYLVEKNISTNLVTALEIYIDKLFINRNKQKKAEHIFSRDITIESETENYQATALRLEKALENSIYTRYSFISSYHENKNSYSFKLTGYSKEVLSKDVVNKELENIKTSLA